MSRPRTSIDHGSYGFARRTRCECKPCSLVRTRYDKARRVAQQRGVSNFVDAQPAREHIQMLMEGGASWQLISDAATTPARGVTRTQIKCIDTVSRAGVPVKTIHRDTAAAILAVTPSDVGQKIVPNVGIRRRVEALQYMGWSVMHVARELDITDEALRHSMERDRSWVHTIENVDRVYQRLSMQRGPSERARFTAYRRDLAPPMAWEPETIDDPDAEPDMTCRTCVVARCPRLAIKSSLCRRHLQMMRERNALEDADRYRWHVYSLGKITTSHVPNLTERIADLRAMGLSKEETAQRLGRRLSYIDRVWGSSA